MSAEVLREAARLMRVRADAFPSEPNPARVDIDRHGTCDGCCETTRLVASYPDPPEAPITEPWLCAECAAHADFVASWHPAVALAVADWLDAVAAVHWPKRHDYPSDSHYNAEPAHDDVFADCDESCWTQGFICNGCGTSTCKPEISGRALAVARAYLGDPK